MLLRPKLDKDLHFFIRVRMISAKNGFEANNPKQGKLQSILHSVEPCPSLHRLSALLNSTSGLIRHQLFRSKSGGPWCSCDNGRQVGPI